MYDTLLDELFAVVQKSHSVFWPVDVSWHVSSFFPTQVTTAGHGCESLPWVLPSGANVYMWDANKIQR